ncbi:MAG: response regulator [Candidatus Omnitrophota bacterium]
MKILIVEDSSVQRKVIITTLEKSGAKAEILEAENGNQGIEILGRHYKDIKLIICDWAMPELSGIEFIEAVAKVPALAQIPIIMLSTEHEEEKKQEAYAKHPGLKGYIKKPFTADELQKAVHPILK